MTDEEIQLKLHTRALDLVEKRGMLYGTALREARREYSDNRYFETCEKMGKAEETRKDQYASVADHVSDLCVKHFRHKTVPANFTEIVRKMTAIAIGGGDVERALHDGVDQDIHQYDAEMLAILAKKYARQSSRVRRY